MKTVLVTGFEPFGGEARNPSQEIARRLDGVTIGHHAVVGAVLPCVFGAALRELKRQITATRPKLVIALGMAAGRRAITPERVAINLDDARIPDNAGQQPEDRPIVRGGPAAHWSTLPIKAIVAALNEQGIAAEVSSTAGTFVCNHVFYGLMHGLRRRPWRAIRGGFIHVPPLPEQAPPGQPSLPLETMVAGIETAIAVCVRRPPHDRRVPVSRHEERAPSRRAADSTGNARSDRGSAPLSIGSRGKVARNELESSPGPRPSGSAARRDGARSS